MSEMDGGRTTVAEADVAEQVMHQLGKLARLVRRPAAGGTGLEPVWLPVLMKLAEAGPRRAGELAVALGSSPSTISRQVAGLVRAGLVERRADHWDGRVSVLAVTAAGHRALDAERRRWAARCQAALAGWSAESRGRFADLLGCFVGDLQRCYQPVTRIPAQSWSEPGKRSADVHGQ